VEEYAESIGQISRVGVDAGYVGDRLNAWRRRVLLRLVCERLESDGYWRNAEAPEPWEWNATKLAAWMAKTEELRYTPLIRRILKESEAPEVADLVAGLIALEGIHE
jgi:hypothetical protein